MFASHAAPYPPSEGHAERATEARRYAGSVLAHRLAVVSAAAMATAFALACSTGTPPAGTTAPPAGAPTPAPSPVDATPALAPTPTIEGTATPTPPHAAPSLTSTATPTAAATASPTPGSSGEVAPIGLEATSRAAYRAALDARDGGDLDAAVAGFAEVRDGGGSLASMAALRLAQALAQAERDADAAEAFAVAIADPALPGAVLHVARIEHAAVLARLGRDADAVAALAAAAARWRRAELLRDAGDALWVDDALAVVASAPGSSSAAAALDALEAAGVAVSAGQAAYARYRNWDNATATTRYQGIAAAPATAFDAATAWFYLGALAERRLDNPAAIDAYTRSLAADDAGGLADDAH